MARKLLEANGVAGVSRVVSWPVHALGAGLETQPASWQGSPQLCAVGLQSREHAAFGTSDLGGYGTDVLSYEDEDDDDEDFDEDDDVDDEEGGNEDEEDFEEEDDDFLDDEDEDLDDDDAGDDDDADEDDEDL